MFGNLIAFLVLIALVGLFGWLVFRAWKAKRWFIKWPGLILSGLLTLVFVVVTFLAGKGLAFMYIPPAPAPALTVEGTPEQIARGEYLVKIACVGCHSGTGDREFPLTGGYTFSEGSPTGDVVVANITPDGVLAGRTDGELFRAIRYGYGKGQRAISMTYEPYRQLSDEDTIAIIAFLRSQEPVTTATNGGDNPNILSAIVYGADLLPPPETTEGIITTPPQGATADYGKYVATFGACRQCHGPDMTGAEANIVFPAMPDPRPFVGTLTLEQFVETMRTGQRPDGSELVDMPWQNAAAMSEDDLAALYAYLTAPVK